jgi:hypothetical protein
VKVALRGGHVESYQVHEERKQQNWVNRKYISGLGQEESEERVLFESVV